ncbi:MAG: sulfite exporter TauE/SafE family protein [Simkaniaceae bacterium]|nr:sulfite exporter TauE/SafE family protein [Simkaniaceae bacterium]
MIVPIPALLFVFAHIGIPSAEIMRLTINTALAAMVFNTFSASYFHYKKGAVLVSIVKPMRLGISIGTIVGALSARIVSSSFLQVFFGIFKILFGIRFLLPEPKMKKEKQPPSLLGLLIISMGVSTLSRMLGLGGGMVNVPILTSFNSPA